MAGNDWSGQFKPLTRSAGTWVAGALEAWVGGWEQYFNALQEDQNELPTKLANAYCVGWAAYCEKLAGVAIAAQGEVLTPASTGSVNNP